MDNIENVVQDLTLAFEVGIDKYLASHKMSKIQITAWESMCFEARMRIRDPEGDFRKKATVLRYAVVQTAKNISNYLPSKYSVVGSTTEITVICGIDFKGWTLDGYVIPRLASGFYAAKEVNIHELIEILLKEDSNE